ncbi:Kelch repeat-containing protein [Leptospira santarosai]|uniref:Kelch repeat protein n=1 Tax=Leptospira santarosai str. MOR084 TaxID=1049984 RepID=A0A0E2BGB1_9LEPT|nr:kelch repeat-containing protein [Leptospira santarosai]EKO34239.1 kelch repeat protein [Leptospira santarosai str. MOR084]
MIRTKTAIILLGMLLLIGCQKGESSKHLLSPLFFSETSTTTSNTKTPQNSPNDIPGLPNRPPLDNNPAPESPTQACTTNVRAWFRNEFPSPSRTLTILDNGMVVSAPFGAVEDSISSVFFPIANGAAWNFGPQLTVVRSHYPVAAPISATRVLLSGGFDFPSWDPLRSVEILDTAGVPVFDPGTGEIVTDSRHLNTNPMNSLRGAHVLTVLADGRILATGGDIFNDTLSPAEIYDPILDQWTETGPVQERKIFHTATRLNDGRVMIVGGYGDDGKALKTTSIYNPQTNQWIDGPDLHEIRNAHTATLLQDGRLLIAGGDGNLGTNDYRNTMEIYNPNTNQWTLLFMPGPRTEHGAFLEVDGSVVIAGGRNSSLVKSTLRYSPTMDSWCHLADLPDGVGGFTEAPMILLPTGGATFGGGLSLR